ncbi:DEAD/DEAH box helicase family protein [Nonomuraea sp. NPDC049714]|uniref:DEAD/DEAH box helicase family protein n=1 Tax=Nonomuraea sp. NPDC049714 TaxID=3364357 RepID=UPI0037931154
MRKPIEGARLPAKYVVLDFAHVDFRPYSYQREILDELDAERQIHNRWRNLVVMATGAGKTVVAALDYRRLRATGQAESVLRRDEETGGAPAT